MGAEPYWYFEKFDGDVDAALQSLRQREFAAGRYNPAITFLWQLFPIGPNSPAPGAKHSSIQEALEDPAQMERGRFSTSTMSQTNLKPAL